MDWDKYQRPLKTTASLQVVINPLLRRGSRFHGRAFRDLASLGADSVCYVPWLPYPRLAVAELEPPDKDKTSWDFSLIDPVTEDFPSATKGHSTIMNFSTQLSWLFAQKKPVVVSSDADAVQWDYVQGKELRDASGNELADYYGRLVSWYTLAGRLCG